MSDAETHWETAEEGAELLRDGEREQAVELLSELLTREPQNEYAYFFLGSAYFELEQYDRALKCYVQALSLVPTYVGAMVHAGHSLRMLGRYKEAVRMAHQVLVRAPHDPDALFLIGACSFAVGDDGKAKDYLERFLHTNPEIEVATEVQGMMQVIMARDPSQPLQDDDADD
jgi:tetratricopeptide (TPR) repeat protein